MVAEDFLQDPQVRKWLDGVEPAWTLLTFDSSQAMQPDYPASECSRKKRSISLVASGPRGSVYEPAGLPPDQAWPAP